MAATRADPFRAARDRRGTPSDLLVVGLGNPGDEYAGTRHNVGADAVELVAERHGVDLKHRRGSTARTGEAVVQGRRLALAVPTLFMNESGTAVPPLLKRFGV